MSILSDYNDAREELAVALRKAAKHIEIAQHIAVDYSLDSINDSLSAAWGHIYGIQKQHNLE